jgi:nucleotide-binding universal stress UspA family protein
MFTKVIWATDGSEPADRALGLAASIATQNGAALVAIHVVEGLGPGAGGIDLDEVERQAKIDKQVQELVERGVNATKRMVAGRGSTAAHAIADAASDEAADLIVCAARGLTTLKGLLLGSVTQRLLYVAPCPVLVVPGRQ